MEDLLKLWQVVAADVAARCDCISTTHDVEIVMRRSKTEGLSFLTITLPEFGKDFEKSLERGQVSSELFRGWAKSPSKGQQLALPKFLRGFTSLVFDCSTGVLLDQPNVEAIFAIRQLTLMFGKILVPCSDARIDAALRMYVECEQEVKTSDAQMAPHLFEEFKKASTVLYGGVFQQVDEDVYYGRIIPKHGPGATADRLKGNLKFDQAEWTVRLERIFPFGEFLVPNYRYHFDILSRVNFLEPGAERPVKVITVPKTLKTPRIIAIEPTCMQYVQQGLMEKFVGYLESESLSFFRSSPVGNPAYGVVGFRDQTPNQRMARLGSREGSLATLDLSEASDRVSNQLVNVMFENYPHLREGVDSCRSRRADVPGHGEIRLAKFASMGSALTFPIEAMVFSTVVFLGIAKALNTSVSHKLLQEYSGAVRVYGDDIIIPAEFAVPVIETLELFGFKVNRNKSFWNGKFRESCGKEYYDGNDVSIVRCRRELPTSLAHVAEVLSCSSMRNQFYLLGLWGTAAWLDAKLDKILMGNYPLVTPESSVIGRVSVPFGYETQRMHPHLHTPLVKGFVPSSKLPKSAINGLAALIKVFLKRSDEPFADKDHLLHGGRPEAVNIKLRWTQPF